MRAEVRPAKGGDSAAVQRPARHDAMQEALAELGEAIANGHAQHICSAYQVFRAVTRAMASAELFALADRTLGVATREAVVSAYSRRGCFMCTDGTLPCDQCEGTGEVEDGRDCPHCEGRGCGPCGFCNGTSWADRDTIPQDLRDDVVRRQLRHVRSQLRKLNEELPQTGIEAIRHFSRPQRQQLTGWLRRLQARAQDLAEAGAQPNGSLKSYLLDQAEKIEACLEKLRAQ